MVDPPYLSGWPDSIRTGFSFPAPSALSGMPSPAASDESTPEGLIE
jgi:hypothetical protein